MKKNLIVVIVLALFLTACTQPCNKANVTKAQDQYAQILSRWSDAFTLAQATPRGYVIDPIIEMQHIKWSVQDVSIPACVEPAREDLLNSMQSVIDGMVSFMGDSPDSVVTTKFEAAGPLMKSYNDKMEELLK